MGVKTWVGVCWRVPRSAVIKRSLKEQRTSKECNRSKGSIEVVHCQ